MSTPSSINDQRWEVSVQNEFLDYDFLIRKLFENKWLGIVIKPKKPNIFHQKFKDYKSLFDKALNTGRLHIFTGDWNYLPSDAALCSDISIQNYIHTGSAAVESALTNTKTLILDRQKWKHSVIYNYDKNNQIIFNSWEQIWNIVFYHFMKKEIPELGNWKNFIQDIDPYRDGKAFIRYTDLLNWQLEDFNRGLDYKKTLLNSIEKFSDKYGPDKVIELRGFK